MYNNYNMAFSLDFIKFKKILSENEIEIFDYEFRIAHHRLCNWEKTKSQLGGSKNINIKNISSKLKNMSQIHLSHLIGSLLIKNDEKINWILNLY